MFPAGLSTCASVVQIDMEDAFIQLNSSGNSYMWRFAMHFAL